MRLLYAQGGAETIFSAVALDDLDGIERRLADGKSLELSGIDGLHPLHLACRRRSVVALERLLSHGADLGARSSDGLEPLHEAIQSGWAEGVRVLARAGVDVDSIGGQGTALQQALRAGNAELLALLLSLGADPALKRTGEPSPLNEARGLASRNAQAFDGIVELLRAALSR